MPHKRFSDLQQDIEKTVKDLKGSPDPQDRRALLRKMRILIDDADRLLLLKKSAD